MPNIPSRSPHKIDSSNEEVLLVKKEYNQKHIEQVHQVLVEKLIYIYLKEMRGGFHELRNENTILFYDEVSDTSNNLPHGIRTYARYILTKTRI